MKIVAVRWRDSSFQGDLLATEDLDSNCTLETVGFLAMENDHALSVAHEWCETSKAWRGVTHILKPTIIRRRIVK